jgi:hypothetical protein
VSIVLAEGFLQVSAVTAFLNQVLFWSRRRRLDGILLNRTPLRLTLLLGDIGGLSGRGRPLLTHVDVLRRTIGLLLRGRALLLLALRILGRAIAAASAIVSLTLVGTAAFLTVSIGFVVLLGVSFVVGVASVPELHWFAGNEELFVGLVLKDGFRWVFG